MNIVYTLPVTKRLIPSTNPTYWQVYGIVPCLAPLFTGAVN